MTAITPSQSWRQWLRIHPAADLFPVMSVEELKELGEDIKQNGLHQPCVLLEGEHDENILIDGRNRLDAMESLGLEIGGKCVDGFNRPIFTRMCNHHGKDPYALAISLNIHRRHFTGEQKRELIGKLLKAAPEKSDRTIAKIVKRDHKTVGAIRDKLEATGEIPQLEKTVGADGKERKRRMPNADPDCWDCGGNGYFNGGNNGRCHCVGHKDDDKESARADDSPLETSAIDENDPGVAAPEEIYGNIIDTIERHKAVVRAYKKILRVSTLDQALKNEVSAAIGTLITTWQSLQSREVINPLIAAWDKAEPKQRRDFILARKIEIIRAQNEIGHQAFGDRPHPAYVKANPDRQNDDGLDIPAYLRRAPKKGPRHDRECH